MSGREKPKKNRCPLIGRLLGWPLFLFASFSVQSQDIHYSLYSFTPLSLNPALVAAGSTPEVSFIYRRRGIGLPENSPLSQIGLTQPLYSNGRKWGGIGLQVAEKVGDNASLVRQPRFTAAAAYHLRLSRYQSLSLGFSGSFGDRQHQPVERLTVENFRSRPQPIFKLNSGLFYRAADYNGQEWFYLGLALMQASLPEENFTFYHKVPSTFLLTSGLTIWRNELVAVMPQFMWNNRAGQNFIHAGGKVSLSLDQLRAPLLQPEGNIELGFGYIREQALVVSLSLLQPLYQVGFSYDFKASEASFARGYRSGSEVALRIFPEKAVQWLKEREREMERSGPKEGPRTNIQPLPFLKLRRNALLPAQTQASQLVKLKEMAPAVHSSLPLKEELPQVFSPAFEGRNLYFKLNKNSVEAEEELQFLLALVRFLEQHPTHTVRVVGHTDNTGSGEANILLSFRRAQVVGDFLMAAGIQGERVVVEGHGAFNPLVPNTSEQNRAKNRRVEIFFDSQP